MKTSYLIGHPLNYAVSVVEARRGGLQDDFWLDEVKAGNFDPSSSWSEGGPIIEREKLDIRARVPDDVLYPNPRFAWKAECVATNPYFCGTGPTPLIAAMRCFVASKLGDEIEIPKELM